MSSHAIAWWVAGVSGVGLAALAFLLLRRFPLLSGLRWFVPALVLMLGLAPYRFDEAHLAPAWVVAVFRTFFEAGMDPGPPWRLLGAAATGFCAAYIAALSLRGVGHAILRRFRPRPAGAPEAQIDAEGALGAPKQVK
ncbi:MAG: hypothetical protein F4Y86_07705 [Gammaproteobacteria bacterium]|nr:hypothetical protein [Gammaproteobacteria bacterium]MYB36534.1 hypothetical protein [Gammaproteobacteria bacterium]